MNLFDQLMLRADAWLDALDRERDVAMRMMERRGRTPELAVWLDQLDAERSRHLFLMDELRDLRRANHPALLLSERPSGMLKAGLPSNPVRKRA